MLNNGELMDKVRDLVEESGLEPSEIARRCGEPEKKIRQILDGAKNPSFTPLCEIITACGGSVDIIIGAAPTSVQTSPSNDGLVIQLRADLRHERKRGAQGWTLFVVSVALIIAMLLFDLLNPQFGWFRYEIQQQATHEGTKTAYVTMCRAIGAIREFIL
mgnify:CR=1 FL=1